ncbi:MAG TPA: Rne/Rng family ribonuclease [Terriglobales bacterium]|nr:Rne/Rng family ribonuclease [Terriglobales bacterium]
MSKELFVSSTPHETKVAIIEDDLLAEIYFERENEYTLAGSIYKGRVTRVLPGMQSAFVDIGLERDAFLYVSDFFEDQEEYDAVVTQAEEEVGKLQGRQVEPAGRPESGEVPTPTPPPVSAPAESEAGSRRWRGRRRRGRRGRDFGREQAPRPQVPASTTPPAYQPIVLPGESISKYRRLADQHPTVEPISPAAELGFSAPAEPAEASAPPGGFEITGGYEESAHPSHWPAEDTSAAVEALETPAESQEAKPDAPAAPILPWNPDLVEEEEIDEEETDVPALAAAEDDEIVFEDLEEQTLESSTGQEILEAVEESRIERSATGDYESEAPGYVPAEVDREELEEEEAELQPSAEGAEAELIAEAKEEADELEEDTALAGHAELRGPAPTAAFQQRTERAEQPGLGRRRGRRGGRGTSRRNIQRGPHRLITDLLKEGQEILVQIAKEPMGKKGARITSHIALPGRFLVYMPTVDHIGVSRKIVSEEERQRLKRILSSERNGAHGGFIVRTAAGGASEEDLRADIRFLINLWNEIRNRAEAGKAPALIYHDLNVVERILRDQVTETFSHIWVDSEAEYERVLRFVNRFQPALVKRVKLYAKETPLFEQFNIQEEINKALKSKVWLKSGGYIVINQTEALVAVDINTGKYVGKTARLEDTIVKTNIEAIKEIVRQVRLRDLGGIIVIDFIDMDERRNRQKVMQALEEALRHDRAPSKVLQFNDFGLVAITRKRVKQSLERTLGMPCNYCTGTGLIKSVPTVCNEIYVEMRKMAQHFERPDVMLRVHPDVAKALKAGGARLLQEMEELTGRTIIVKADPAIHQEQFDIN